MNRVFLAQRPEILLLVLAMALVVLPAWLKGWSSIHRTASTVSFADKLDRGLVDPNWIDGMGPTMEPPRIDIRTAPWYEWTLLEGIGEARARRLVEFRVENGGFSSLDDLRGVPGMPRGWVEKAAPYLQVSKPLSSRGAQDPGA